MSNLLHTKRDRNKALLPFSVIHAASQGGTLPAMTVATDNDTPALDALKASCGAPISMGRGEIPVRLAATSRLFCLREEIECKAVELADKYLPVCSTAFWLESERSVHNGDGGGDT